MELKLNYSHKQFSVQQLVHGMKYTVYKDLKLLFETFLMQKIICNNSSV